MTSSLLILNKLLKPDTGGVEEVVEQHRHILSHSFDVTAWGAHSNNTSKTSKTEDSSGVKVHFKSSFQIFSMPVSIAMMIAYIKNVKKYDIVMIHAPFPVGMLLTLLRKPKRLIVVWHSDIVRPKRLKPLLKFIDILVLNRCDRIITTSEGLKKHSDTLHHSFDKVDIVPIHTTDKPCTLTQPPELSGLASGFWLFIGRFSYYKGIDVIADALDFYKEGRPIVIAGSGFVNEKLINANEEAHLTIINRTITDAEKGWLLENCYALLFPSTEKSEAFGIVQLEAMQFGKPIINTALKSGVPSVARNGVEAITIKPKNPTMLAEAMARLENQGLHHKLAIAAEERAALSFSLEKVKQNLLDVVMK